MRSAADAIGALFSPRSIAVVGAGANPASLGARRLGQLRNAGFPGKLYAVNPDGADSGETKGYSSISATGGVDLAVIAVPWAGVVDTVRECADVGVPVAQVLSAGPSDPSALHRFEAELLAAGGGATRIVGPNTVGSHSRPARTTFIARPDDRVGGVAYISQSGGLSVDFLNQARDRGLGVSRVASIGNAVDLGLSDFLDYLAGDEETTAIALYAEGVEEGARFLASLRRAAAIKPVVVLKGGRTALGSQTVASHTGSVATEYAIWHAAMLQSGALPVMSFDELLSTLVAVQWGAFESPVHQAALVGNGGGMSVLITDRLAELGLSLAPLDEATRRAVDELDGLAGATLGNPADIPAGALDKMSEDDLETIIRLLRDNTPTEALVVHWNLLPFLGYSDPDGLVAKIARALGAARGGKPIHVGLRSTSDSDVIRLRAVFADECSRLGIPTFRDGIEAAEALARASEIARLRAQRTVGSEPVPEVERARPLSRTGGPLPQSESQRVLAEAGVPVAEGMLCRTEEELARACAEIRPPWALKLEAPGLVHKSDVGGVVLDVATMEQASTVFRSLMQLEGLAADEDPGRGVYLQAMVHGDGTELIIGVKRDPSLGPVIAIGLGGVLVELLRSVSLRVLPISREEARMMLGEFRGAELLRGFRGSEPWELDSLVDLVLAVADVVLAHPEISELDLNPVLRRVDGGGLVVVDSAFITTPAVEAGTDPLETRQGAHSS